MWCVLLGNVNPLFCGVKQGAVCVMSFTVCSGNDAYWAMLEAAMEGLLHVGCGHVTISSRRKARVRA